MVLDLGRRYTNDTLSLVTAQLLNIYVRSKVRNWIKLTLGGKSRYYPKVMGNVSKKLSERTLPR